MTNLTEQIGNTLLRRLDEAERYELHRQIRIRAIKEQELANQRFNETKHWWQARRPEYLINDFRLVPTPFLLGMTNNVRDILDGLKDEL